MKLTAHDLSLFRERSIRNFVRVPPRSRLQGMARDLTEEEIRLLSMLEAAVETLTHVGALSPEEAAEIKFATHQQTSLMDQIEA